MSVVMLITNKHKLIKKGDDKADASRGIRCHDFESPNSKNGRANLEKAIHERPDQTKQEKMD